MTHRILYVVTEDWYFVSHRLPMARAAAAAGYEVHVAARFRRQRADVEQEGYVCHDLNWRRGSLSPLDSFEAIREIRALIRTCGPDIVHNVSLKPVLLGSVASLGLPPIVVNSLTGVGSLFITELGVNKMTRTVVQFLLGRLLQRTKSTTVVQNVDDQDFVAALGAPSERTVLIRGSGVDIETLVPLPEPTEPVTAAYVGRMLVDKGVQNLLEAFAALKDSRIPLRLILAGDCDPENPRSLSPDQLRSETDVVGIEWLGHVTDIRDVWSRAHFAVLPSRREGLPKSLLEAAAYGRAMVATDVPGCREIAIEGETALTVPADDPVALAEAMARMANDREMRADFGRAARELVEREFSADRIGQETVDLYDRILRHRASD
ncbi:MAG: glycosyl transferase family 1 [Methyloceanibacter sp.]|nr:MAG: glycosyl transferase family 1 [Methyloceanibacter sp.]